MVRPVENKLDTMAFEANNNTSEKYTRAKTRRLSGNDINHFPPPEGVPDYATRNLPPLPPRPTSTPSSIYNSNSGFRRPTANHLHRRDSPISHLGQTNKSSGSGGSEVVLDMRPPDMSIVTEFRQDSRKEQREVIHSPRPRLPNQKTMNELRLNNGFEVSPILSPGAGTLFYQTHEVSPLTPEDAYIRGFEKTIMERGRCTQWAAKSRLNSRRHSPWDDIPPVTSHLSLGFYPVPVKVARRKPSDKEQQLQSRYSDPGSPLEGSGTGGRAFGSKAFREYLTNLEQWLEQWLRTPRRDGENGVQQAHI